MKEDIKKHGLAALLVTWLPLIPVLWFIGKPLISDALASDIEQSVKQEVAPINQAFVTLLKREIRELSSDIAAMEFEKTNSEDWTALDEQNLTNLKLALEEAKEAKEDLENEDG